MIRAERLPLSELVDNVLKEPFHAILVFIGTYFDLVGGVKLFPELCVRDQPFACLSISIITASLKLLIAEILGDMIGAFKILLHRLSYSVLGGVQLQGLSSGNPVPPIKQA